MGDFYSTLISLIGYSQCQQHLINQMQSTCLKVADTRWISMHSTTKWLVQNCLHVTEYLNVKTSVCVPDTLWWVFLHAIQVFAFESDLFHFLKRINYHFIRATALHEWINQHLLPSNWNVGSITH
jgi:hypothetical protein